MKSHYVCVLFCALSFIVVRSLLHIHLFRLVMTKKERSFYKKEVPPLSRWLLLEIPRYVKNKRSKSEGKIIQYVVIAKIYRLVILIMQCLLLIHVVAFFLMIASALEPKWLSLIVVAEVACNIVCFFVFAVVNGYERKNYHRRRVGKE